MIAEMATLIVTLNACSFAYFPAIVATKIKPFLVQNALYLIFLFVNIVNIGIPVNTNYVGPKV